MRASHRKKIYLGKKYPTGLHGFKLKGKKGPKENGTQDKAAKNKYGNIE